MVGNLKHTYGHSSSADYTMLTDVRNTLSGMGTFSERIRRAIDERGVTQAELAKVCRVSPPTISQWCSGSSKGPKPEHLVAAADFLRVEIRWLATGNGPRNREDAPRWVDLAGLPDDQRRLFRELIDSARQAVAVEQDRKAS